MCQMGKERTLGTYAASKSNGITYKHVTMVLALKAQCVHDQCLHASQAFAVLIADSLHVGDIGKRSEPIGQDRQPVVHHLHSLPCDVANSPFLGRTDGMQIQQGNTRVEFRRKAIRHRHAQGINCLLIGIDIDVAELAKTTQVVDACHVVIMNMSEQYSVDFSERPMHQLHTYVGPTVYKDTRGVGLQQSATPIAEVARILAAAHFAPTPQHGDASRGTCSQKRKLHPSYL